MIRSCLRWAALAGAMVLGPEELRMLRAIEELEVIGTAEARKMLETLASGAAGERVTEEAAGAVERRWWLK